MGVRPIGLSVCQCSARLVLALVVLMLALAANCKAAEQNAAWKSDIVIINRHFDRLECQSAWELLWKHIKNGNKIAMLSVWGTMYGRGLRLPGAPTDLPFLERLLTILAVYGYDAKDPPDSPSQKMLKMFTSHSLSTMARACDEKAFDAGRCVQEAISKKLVPSFESFVEEIEAYQSRPGAKAFCDNKFKG